MNDEPAQEILGATYRALCEHGYAALTLQDIAAEADRSKASIHYHYDSKDELFVAFLDFLYERYADHLDSAAGDTPREHLLSLLDTLLTDAEDAPDTGFRTAMLEVQAQAPYNDAVQDQLTAFDERLFGQLREIIEAGIDAGEFGESVDPELAAEFLTTTINGAHTRQVAVDHSTGPLYDAVRRYVETQLVADAAGVTH